MYSFAYASLAVAASIPLHKVQQPLLPNHQAGGLKSHNIHVMLAFIESGGNMQKLAEIPLNTRIVAGTLLCRWSWSFQLCARLGQAPCLSVDCSSSKSSPRATDTAARPQYTKPSKRYQNRYGSHSRRPFDITRTPGQNHVQNHAKDGCQRERGNERRRGAR